MDLGLSGKVVVGSEDTLLVGRGGILCPGKRRLPLEAGSHRGAFLELDFEDRLTMVSILKNIIVQVRKQR